MTQPFVIQPGISTAGPAVLVTPPPGGTVVYTSTQARALGNVLASAATMADYEAALARTLSDRGETSETAGQLIEDIRAHLAPAAPADVPMQSTPPDVS